MKYILILTLLTGNGVDIEVINQGITHYNCNDVGRAWYNGLPGEARKHSTYLCTKERTGVAEWDTRNTGRERGPNIQ